VSRSALLIDLAIAGLVAFLVVILSPGLAVVGLLALAVLVVCGLSFAVDWLVRRVRRS
jgi:hypothetical protein